MQRAKLRFFGLIARRKKNRPSTTAASTTTTFPTQIFMWRSRVTVARPSRCQPRSTKMLHLAP
jgi:hypothetical protein